jgi:Zn-finger nucleic acid-binding protein
METILECPFCKTPMEKINRADVTVDRCPSCQGVWLDKGELDKIVIRRKKHYEKEQKDWGIPRVGTRPPSEDDDVSLLIGEW